MLLTNRFNFLSFARSPGFFWFRKPKMAGVEMYVGKKKRGEVVLTASELCTNPYSVITAAQIRNHNISAQIPLNVADKAAELLNQADGKYHDVSLVAAVSGFAIQYFEADSEYLLLYDEEGNAVSPSQFVKNIDRELQNEPQPSR